MMGSTTITMLASLSGLKRVEEQLRQATLKAGYPAQDINAANAAREAARIQHETSRAAARIEGALRASLLDIKA
ncbi:MAG: hypothetical protein KIT11_03875 [Fimbriimonadaceae bacterium]|nr:hypothetical protein [Fimbriimonadaceae bacterium]QYK56964.1 MAG: hypothetical protein KF733_05650 [Fimbriimonadaceae bacterium]